jgi:NAD(P)-dependent dehydrogenase (short-subunit alcohol dehydrogenase family)
MAQSFTASKTGSLACDTERGGTRRTVLVTGAAGNIGSYFAEHSHAKYGLRLMVRADEDEAAVEKLRGFGDVVTGDLSDLEGLKRLCGGVDTVVHLAASASPDTTWEQLLPNNIVGTYNIMVAAKAAGCRRVIYASSIHAVSGYPADVQVKTSEPVNPGDLYGVTKCFGEAMGRYMAGQEGLSVIALRIGAFQPLDSARDAEKGVEMMDMFVSRRDLSQLIERCVNVGNLKFAILHGLSDNRFKRLDISDARELVGYAPQDDSTELNPRLNRLDLDDRVLAANQGDPGQKSGIREDV